MEQQKKEYAQSQTNANELINSAYSEQIQTREQFQDSGIWIITKGNKAIATIGDNLIMERNTSKEIEEELTNPTIKTYIIIAAVIADKVSLANLVRNIK